MARYETLYRLSKYLIPPRYDQSLRQLLRVDRVHWCRVIMDREVDRFIRSLDHNRLDVLEISGTHFRDKFKFVRSERLSIPITTCVQGR